MSSQITEQHSLDGVAMHGVEPRAGSITGTLGTFARELGFSRDVLRRIVSEAGISPVATTRRQDPLYRLHDIFGAVLRDRDAELSPSGRLSNARAQLAEDDLRVRRGELLDADDVAQAYGRLFKSVVRAFDIAVDCLERDTDLRPDQVVYLENHFDRVREQLAEEVRGGGGSTSSASADE